MPHLPRIDTGLGYDHPTMVAARADGASYAAEHDLHGAENMDDARALAKAARRYSRVADIQLAFMDGAG